MITSVRHRRTFAELRSDGRRVRHGSVRMSFLPAPGHDAPAVAFAIGRKFGNAVERNRCRRRLRAAFAEAFAARPDAQARPLLGDYLLSGNRGLLTNPYQRLVADVDACLTKLATGGTP